MGIVNFLANQGFEVTLVSGEKLKHSSDLGIQGVRYQHMNIHSEEDREGFAHGFAGKQPDLTFFDTFVAEEMFGPYIAHHFPNSGRVLDLQDLHSLRVARERAYAEGKNPMEVLRSKPHESPDTTLFLREMSSIYRSDHVITCSSYEQILLSSYPFVPETSLVTFFYPKLPPSPASVSMGRRKNFVWIGNFMHRPNLEAARVLVEQVVPELEKELGGGWVLDLYGSNFSQEIERICRQSQGKVRAKGVMKSLKSLGKYRALLAPISFGAGIKG